MSYFGGVFPVYRRLESQEEYVQIDQSKAWVAVYCHMPAGWVQDVYDVGEPVRLASIDLVIPMVELYADTGMAMSKATLAWAVAAREMEMAA